MVLGHSGCVLKSELYVSRALSFSPGPLKIVFGLVNLFENCINCSRKTCKFSHFVFVIKITSVEFRQWFYVNGVV